MGSLVHSQPPVLLPSPSITDPEFAKGGVGRTHRVMEQPNTSRYTLQRMPTAAPLTYTGIGGHALPQSKPRHSDREASSFSHHREKEKQATTISRAPWHCHCHWGSATVNTWVLCMPRDNEALHLPAAALCAASRPFFILFKNEDQKNPEGLCSHSNYPQLKRSAEDWAHGLQG